MAKLIEMYEESKTPSIWGRVADGIVVHRPDIKYLVRQTIQLVRCQIKAIYVYQMCIICISWHDTD